VRVAEGVKWELQRMEWKLQRGWGESCREETVRVAGRKRWGLQGGNGEGCREEMVRVAERRGWGLQWGRVVVSGDWPDEITWQLHGKYKLLRLLFLVTWAKDMLFVLGFLVVR
jgi:hypothetical protein